MKILTLVLTLTFYLFSIELITPIPESIKYNKERAKLGKLLFHETKLSGDNSISCATCHDLDRGGVDRLSYSFGVDGKTGTIHTPTVYNAVFNIAQFWDGRVKTLKEQASGPIHNPKEMNSDFKEVVKKLTEEKRYRDLFNKLYTDGITGDNIVDAIAEFEKALTTPHSRFDRYLKGDFKAITDQEKEGYELFKSHGCISCHHGVNVGGNLYHQFGVIKKFNDNFNNLGRFNVTKDEDDKYYFKVPTLRNINETAPYFHNGGTWDLKEAIQIMGEYQLGKRLNEDETEKIYKFLLTLTGETPKIAKDKSAKE